MGKFRITKGLDAAKITAELEAGINEYGATAAAKLERSAKQNAPWIDRTGNARNSIQGQFKKEGRKAIAEISGNVDYFVYLELCHEKKNAILVPTIDKEGPEILKGYRSIFK